jgi:biofilm protein TabA
MILDKIGQAERYFSLNPGFPAAFAFLRRTDLAELPDGRYEVDGEKVYALVQRRVGKRPEDGRLEAHQKYIDIQFVLAGVDHMGWKSLPDCEQIEKPYDQAKDVVHFADRPAVWITVEPGGFGLFFPEDAHLPLIGEGEIHKVVIKVLA